MCSGAGRKTPSTRCVDLPSEYRVAGPKVHFRGGLWCDGDESDLYSTGRRYRPRNDPETRGACAPGAADVTQSTRREELVLPADVLAAMHGAAVEGGEGAALLERIGRALGRPILESLSGSDEGDHEATSADDFWAALRDYFSSHGWGTVSHERVHPGLGRIRAVDWAEPAGDDGRIPLTAGLLAGLFTAVAGRPIDVLEAPGSEAEPDPSFLFGSPDAVEALRGLLGDGTDLAGALDRI